jgi:hypothetical protein
MLSSFKSKAPEKDKNAAANAAEVMERTVQQQQSVVEQPPPRREAGADDESGNRLLHRLRHVDRRQHRMQWSSAGLRPNPRRVARLGSPDRRGRTG